MPTTSHSTNPAREDNLLTIADAIQGWTRTPWCDQTNGMVDALPLVAAAARHAHRAIEALAGGELYHAAAFSAAAMVSYQRADSYDSDIEDLDNLFDLLRYSIEASLMGDLPEARKNAAEFVKAIQEFEQNTVRA
jgi:hypothetical protein